MFDFKFIRNASGDITHIETNMTGSQLLRFAKLNKGCAFSQDEREQFALTGLLPHHIETLDEQLRRMYIQYEEHRTNLGKNIYLNMLHDYNETLFYKLASDHLEEMLPIVYTPTVGEAVQRFSLEHRKPRGIYISYPDRDRIEEILNHRFSHDVDLTVVTDGEAVLGIGDQGIGGINISIAKLMVYTLCAGINPHRVLPIQLDVGTNNTYLLNDPMYLGWRHERISKNEYDDFIDQFVTIIKKKFPTIFLHWEDVGRDNARRILTRYRNDICTMNGDMQSTGVVGLACVLAGVHASGLALPNHRVVILGGGNAGIGIADQIYAALQRAGLTDAEASKRFWIVDRDGLITTATNALPFQERYRRDANELKNWQCRDQRNITLFDVVNNAKPTILIGCSTASGAFTEEIVKAMASHAERPIIMPLSNPTSLAEANPEDLFEWTQGKALVATGSPYPDVTYHGKRNRIAQSNNALAFPGLGLGVIASKAKHLTDHMLWAATLALRDCAPIMQDKTAPLLPKISAAKIVSLKVANAVFDAAREEGIARVESQLTFNEVIKQISWEPKYYPYIKK